jgi:hypothetical protein
MDTSIHRTKKLNTSALTISKANPKDFESDPSSSSLSESSSLDSNYSGPDGSLPNKLDRSVPNSGIKQKAPSINISEVSSSDQSSSDFVGNSTSKQKTPSISISKASESDESSSDLSVESSESNKSEKRMQL